MVRVLDRSSDIAVALEELLVAWVRTMSAPQQLSFAAASTLATLCRSGPHAIGELAATEHVSQPAMTQLVDRLERDGLVERRRPSGDQRIVSVAATRRGRALLARRRGLRAERLREVYGRLAPAEQATLTAAMPALERLTQLARAGVEEQALAG